MVRIPPLHGGDRGFESHSGHEHFLLNFIKRLNDRIYNWYVDGDHLLLRFILGRGAFRNDINDKCILCKNSDNSQEHVVNECAKTENLRAKLIKELNDLDNATKNNTLLDSIFYWYYSKDLQAKKMIIKV